MANHPRLTSEMLVSVLLRRVAGAGGFGAVLHRGDAQAGGIIVECTERGVPDLWIERGAMADGTDGWQMIANDMTDAEAARRRGQRRRADPDLWIIELDIAQAQRFAAETIAAG